MNDLCGVICSKDYRRWCGGSGLDRLLAFVVAAQLVRDRVPRRRVAARMAAVEYFAMAGRRYLGLDERFACPPRVVGHGDDCFDPRARRRRAIALATKEAPGDPTPGTARPGAAAAVCMCRRPVCAPASQLRFGDQHRGMLISAPRSPRRLQLHDCSEW